MTAYGAVIGVAITLATVLFAPWKMTYKNSRVKLVDVHGIL